MIIASYGFATVVTGSGGRAGSFSSTGVPAGTNANALQIADPSMTSTYAGAEWNQASSQTMDAWDFGDSATPPKLKYGDYDGTSGEDYW